MSKKAFVFFAPGFEEIEALTPVDVLRRAGVEVVMVSITKDVEVIGAHQIAVKTDCVLGVADCESADLLVLPGGMPGSNNLNACAVLKQKLEFHIGKGRLMGAICAAPFILGEMGVLNGHKATCYPGFENRLKGAVVTGKPVEVSLPFVTGRGAGAAMAFSLELVAQLLDRQTADALAVRMVV